MNTFSATASILSERELCQFIRDRYDLQGKIVANYSERVSIVISKQEPQQNYH